MNKKHLLLLVLILMFSCIVYAQELVDYDKQDVRYLKADIDKDGIEEEIDAIAGEIEGEGDVCVIRVKDGKEVYTKAIRIGFDHSYNLSLVDISPNLEPFIGFDCGVGVHGYHLILFRYKGLEEVATFWSDRPSIQIKDVDGDGVKEIITANRDYEINPVKESYVETFKYIDDGRWERSSVYRTATHEYISEDWDKDEADKEAFKGNLKKFDMLEEKEW